jgi:hypothetical protein
MVDLLESAAILQVPDAAALEQEIVRLLNDPAARKALGARATATVKRRTGVVAGVVRQLARVH